MIARESGNVQSLQRPKLRTGTPLLPSRSMPKQVTRPDSRGRENRLHFLMGGATEFTATDAGTGRGEELKPFL